MTRKFFRIASLFLSFVLGGIFLNSCSDMMQMNSEEFTPSGFADVSFSISDTDARTVMPNSDDHNLKKYLYLYNYTLTYADGNDGDVGTEKIICNDFSYDRFLSESNIRLATGKKYKFTLTAKDGDTSRMEGSSIITLSEKPTQTVSIVLMPTGDEFGQKLRVDWIVPDDGVIKTMKAGISQKRGYAEFQRPEEILVPKYKFQEYVFSVLDNPLTADNPHKNDYGTTIKRIGVTYDDVKTNAPRWLDYKFYDANGILVYEGSESVFMIGGKTSSTVIYITPDHYYRRPVKIPVNKDGNLWANNHELGLKLVDEKGNEYIFKPVLDGAGKPTGEFEGLLPGASSGVDSSKTTNGIFDIYVGLEDKGFIKTGAKYDANTGTITGNGGAGIGSGATDTVELLTVEVPQEKVKLTPTGGVIGTNGTVGDGIGKGGLIVPAGQDFTVQVKLETGYGAANGSSITVGGKTVADGGTVILNTKKDDLSGGITLGGVKTLVYGIVYKTQYQLVTWKTGYSPSEAERTFTIENDDVILPLQTNITDVVSGMQCDGWWFGTGTANDNLDNIVKKLNKERSVREKIISYAVSKDVAYNGLDASGAADADKYVVLNVYWIPTNYVEYKLLYKFEKLGTPSEYITDETVVDENGKKVVSFHNVAFEKNKSVIIPNDTIKIPEVPGFTHSASITIDVGSTDDEYVINYTRKNISIKFDGNGGNWSGVETPKTSTGKFGETYSHVDDPVRENHKFLGWYVKGDATQAIVKHAADQKYPANDIEYVAKWEQTHANYTVEFYYEATDSTSANPKYDKTSSYSVKGIIGSFPAFNTTPQTGFTYNEKKRSITAGEGGPSVNSVTAEGNTLVKLYFDRKTVTLTLKSNGGKFVNASGNTTEEIILKGKYGTALPSVDSNGFRVEIPKSPVLEGINDGTAMPNDYDFKAWHVRTESDLEAALPSEFPADNAIYAARWTQINGIYRILHYAESMDKYADGSSKFVSPQSVDGFSGQIEDGSVTKKGKIGSAMVYYHESVTGFNAPVIEVKNSQGVITENPNALLITDDAKTQVAVTYYRKEYTIKFHLNAGGDTNAKWYGVDAAQESSEIVKRTGKFRIDFTQPENPVREHFIFRGWTTTPDGTLADRVDVVSSFTETSPTDYYAVWYSKTSAGLETDTSDIKLSSSVNGNEIVVNVSTPEGSGEWTYSWIVNDVLVPEKGKVLTLLNCLKKDYEIIVVAKHNGKAYTKTEIVTVK